MSTVSVIVAASVVLVLAAVVFLVYVLKKREEFTREKFAFAALTAFLSFAGVVVASIVDKESPWTTISNLIREAMHLPVQHEAPRATDHVLLVLVLGVVAFFIYNLYRNWTGAVSVDEHRRKAERLPLMLVRDGLDEAKRLTRGVPRAVQAGASTAPVQFGSLDIPGYALEWHLQAVDLVVLRNTEWRFDRDQDFHAEHQGWIGVHAKTGRPVALLCRSRSPANADTERFVDYLQSLGKKDGATLLVAVRDSRERRTETVSGLHVEILGEDSLLDDLVDFTDYFEHLRRRVEKDTLADSDKTLAMVYAPSACTLEDGSVVTGTVEDYLVAWSNEVGQRQLALLGEYGQGKSTTALMFAYRLVVQRQAGQPSRIPILIELRGRSPRHTSPAGLLAEWAFPFTRIQPKAVMKLVESGRAIVILEGFDEMALAGDAHARYAHFRVLWAFATPRSKVIFTGRPNYFLDDRELKSSLNIARSAASGPYCESLRITPFDLDQIESALRSYPASTRDGIVALARANPKFHEVAARGSLLYVIGELWGRPGGLGSGVGDINSAEVMRSFIEGAYRRQSEKLIRLVERDKREFADFMVLNTPEREFFMRAIAYFMARVGLPNQIASLRLQRLVEKLVKVIPDHVSAQVEVSSREEATPLRLRVKDMDHSMESIVTDVRTCGLLVTDPSAMDSLKFAHKSFMEYLVAESSVSRYLPGPADDGAADVRAALESMFADEGVLAVWSLLSMPEALAFTAESLAGPFRVAEPLPATRGVAIRKRVALSNMPPIATTFVSGTLRWFTSPLFIRLFFNVMRRRKIEEEDASQLLSELGDMIEPWVLYIATCSAADAPVAPRNGAAESFFVQVSLAWIELNLPHLKLSDGLLGHWGEFQQGASPPPAYPGGDAPAGHDRVV